MIFILLLCVAVNVTKIVIKPPGGTYLYVNVTLHVILCRS